MNTNGSNTNGSNTKGSNTNGWDTKGSSTKGSNTNGLIPLHLHKTVEGSYFHCSLSLCVCEYSCEQNFSRTY